jgi:phage repressor protein C with HTH and peptisase S24 domain
MKMIDEIRRDNLDLLRQELGSLTALAAKLQKDDSQVSQWLQGSKNSGTGKPRGMLAETARYIERCAVKHQGWLDVDHSKSQEIDLTNNPDYPAIRRVRFKLSAGVTGFAVEFDQGEGVPMVFGTAWYAKKGLTPSKLFAVVVANGSMEPGLHDGDIVVVNTECTNPKDGHVFAVNYEGELVIKRLIRDAGEWWLSSDNLDQRRYQRKVCGEGVFLIGEIIHKQSDRI